MPFAVLLCHLYAQCDLHSRKHSILMLQHAFNHSGFICINQIWVLQLENVAQALQITSSIRSWEFNIVLHLSTAAAWRTLVLLNLWQHMHASLKVTWRRCGSAGVFCGFCTGIGSAAHARWLVTAFAEFGNPVTGFRCPNWQHGLHITFTCCPWSQLACASGWHKVRQAAHFTGKLYMQR